MTKIRLEEFHQRPTDELLIRCNCGSDHFLNFTYSKWEEVSGPDEILMGAAVLDEIKPQGILNTLGAVWHLLRGNYCRGEINLNRSDLQQIVGWCDGILEETDPEEMDG